MAGRIIVPADDRRTHAVAFRYIEDRLLAEDLGSPVPDIGIQAIGLSPYFARRIRRAPGGIRTNGDLIVIDRRPAILRPGFVRNHATLRELVGGRRTVGHRLRIREPRLVIGLVIVYNNQVFSAARRDGTRTRHGNRRQAKIDGCTAADVHLHLLRVFVEWLCAAERVTPRG